MSCIIIMQRKYSEVVKYAPSFQSIDTRKNNRVDNNNQKVSPVDLNRPSYSPAAVYNNSSNNQIITPANYTNDVALTRNASFQGPQRRSLPSFYAKINNVQVLNSPVMDSREQANGFRSNPQMNQNTMPSKIDNGGFSYDQQQLYSPQIHPSRNRNFQVGQNAENVRKSMISAHNTPGKLSFFQRNNSLNQNFQTIPPRLQPINNLQIGNNNRQNGRICNSMILQETKIENNFQNTNPILNISLLSNASSNNHTSDLESTFSSDNNYNSYGEISSPSYSDQRQKLKKLEPVQVNSRKKQDVWKSMVHSYSPMKSQNLPSKSQFLTYDDIKGNISSPISFNTNTTDTFRMKQDNIYDIKKTSQVIKQPTNNFEYSYLFKNSSYEQQSSGSRSPQMQFKKKVKDYSINQGIDISENLRPIQYNRRQFTIEDFEVIEKLGRGTYGDVFLVRQKKSRFICVLKSLTKKKIKQLGIQEHVFRQIKIQSYLVHKHVTSLYGVFNDQNKVYLIMQFMPDGNMATNGKKKITQNETAHLIQQVCQGLQYMHRQNIIHRDIKPQNLLLNNAYLKLGDFGCAVFGNSLRTTIVGCYAYMSPQQFSNNPYDEKIDSWCVGTLAYQLLTGKPPFQQKLRKMAKQSQYNNEVKSPQAIIQFSEVQFPKDIKLSTQAVQFIKRLLDPDPATRADIKQALKHKFLLKAKQYQKYLESRL